MVTNVPNKIWTLVFLDMDSGKEYTESVIAGNLESAIGLARANLWGNLELWKTNPARKINEFWIVDCLCQKA